MRRLSLAMIVYVVLVATASVLGTMAYLTDTDSVANTFTIGCVDIDLDEAAVDENGELLLDEEGNPVARVKENEYHLLPGQTYIKDPKITVRANSEEAYVRMLLIVHNAGTVQAIIDKYELGDFSALIGEWDEETWLYEGLMEDAEESSISFEFRYKDTVSAGDAPVELPALFQTLIVPDGVNGEELKALYDPNSDGDDSDGFQMIVNGHAIQAAGFTDEDAAWAAFNEQTATPDNP